MKTIKLQTKFSSERDRLSLVNRILLRSVYNRSVEKNLCTTNLTGLSRQVLATCARVARIPGGILEKAITECVPYSSLRTLSSDDIGEIDENLEGYNESKITTIGVFWLPLLLESFEREIIKAPKTPDFFYPSTSSFFI